ncbi:hypothetical protein CBS101457_002914 [Exobasidium rhododendri]|nr:hypothetical protein CBS101457_002914 [Exobasidium rhododendri]
MMRAVVAAAITVSLLTSVNCSPIELYSDKDGAGHLQRRGNSKSREDYQTFDPSTAGFSTSTGTSSQDVSSASTTSSTNSQRPLLGRTRGGQARGSEEASKGKEHDQVVRVEGKNCQLGRSPTPRLPPKKNFPRKRPEAAAKKSTEKKPVTIPYVEIGKGKESRKEKHAASSSKAQEWQSDPGLFPKYPPDLVHDPADDTIPPIPVEYARFYGKPVYGRKAKGPRKDA